MYLRNPICTIKVAVIRFFVIFPLSNIPPFPDNLIGMYILGSAMLKKKMMSDPLFNIMNWSLLFDLSVETTLSS